MDDKAEAARKYNEWVKQQRRLERSLKAESDEACIREGIDKIPTYEYLKLPKPVIPKIIPLHPKPFVDKPYKGRGEFTSKAEYWAENKEKIKKARDDESEEQKANKRAAKLATKEEQEAHRKEWASKYYQDNKQRIYEYHKSWKEKNREKHQERARLKREEEKAKRKGDYKLGSPSLIRTFVTENGCNVCGFPQPLYNFQNPDTKEYTGCLCVRCLSTFQNVEGDESRLLKLREYVIRRDKTKANARSIVADNAED